MKRNGRTDVPACLYKVEGDIAHTLTACYANNKQRNAMNIKPNIQTTQDLYRSSINLLADDTLESRHQTHTFSPAHMTAKILEVSLKRIAIRLGSHINPISFYARAKKNVERKRYSPTGLLDQSIAS